MRASMPLARHDAPGPTGSSFIEGWYGIVHKDLRGVLAGAPISPFSRVYCGNGVLADNRCDLSDGRRARAVEPDPGDGEPDPPRQQRRTGDGNEPLGDDLRGAA